MGYTTRFRGCVVLSRTLTLAEAKELLEINQDETKAFIPAGIKIDGYMQWVPTEDLESIVWDEGEKFYSYTEWMAWLCGWLADRQIVAGGELVWQGEETGDSGVLTVQANQVSVVRAPRIPLTSDRPLTLERLGAIALELATTKGAK